MNHFCSPLLAAGIPVRFLMREDGKMLLKHFKTLFLFLLWVGLYHFNKARF